VKKRRQIKAPALQLLAIVALTIILLLIVDFGRRAAANYRIQLEAERLTHELAAAKRFQNRLLHQRTYAASDLYVEKVARNEFKWSKPGETVVIVVPTNTEADTRPDPARRITGSAGAVTPQQAWHKLFFGPSATSANLP
jgi:cell division protein FtsB